MYYMTYYMVFDWYFASSSIRGYALCNPALVLNVFFNKINQQYELHNLFDNKIDWSTKISEDELSKWENSYFVYESSFSSKSNNLSSNSIWLD